MAEPTDFGDPSKLTDTQKEQIEFQDFLNDRKINAMMCFQAATEELENTKELARKVSNR